MDDALALVGDVEMPRAAAVFERGPIASLVVDRIGCVVAANDAAVSLLGLDRVELAGLDAGDLVAVKDRSRAKRRISAVGGGAEQVARFEASVLRQGGWNAWTWVHLGRLDGGGVVMQLLDLTGRQQVDGRLAQQRAFRGAILELSELSHQHDADADFYSTLIDRAVEVVPGAQAGSILVRTPGTDEYRFVAAHGFDLAGLQQQFLRESEFFREASDPSAHIVRDFDPSGLPDERRRWLVEVGRIDEIVVNVSAPVIVDGTAVAFISLDNFDDVDAFTATSVEMTTVLGRLIADLWTRRSLEAELRREREAFRHQALHDDLTGLANRRHLEDRIDAAIARSGRRGQPTGLLFVDVDDFKDVNDCHGHGVGDAVIVAVADRLRSATRAGDTVGRWGGDEFVIVSEDVPNIEDVETLTARILAAFDEPLLLDDVSIPIGVTVGAAWTADPVGHRDDLVRCADAALYEAKASGKGIVRLGVL